MELKMSWFSLGSTIDAVVSQVMSLLRANKLQLIQQIPEQVRALFVYGDQVRLQQVLSDFLLHIVRHASYPDGWVELIVTPSLKSNQDGTEFVRLQFRYMITDYLMIKTSASATPIHLNSSSPDFF